MSKYKITDENFHTKHSVFTAREREREREGEGERETVCFLKTFGKIHTTLNSKLIKSLTSTTYRETLNSLLFIFIYI